MYRSPDTGPPVFFRKGESTQRVTKTGQDRQRQDTHEEAICCAQCVAVVSQPLYSVSRNGRHLHTFTNEAGFEYTIVCFTVAEGIRVEGEPTTYWSWFPGYVWQFGFCRICAAHLGWYFNSTAGDQFHALILDRLVYHDF